MQFFVNFLEAWPEGAGYMYYKTCIYDKEYPTSPQAINNERSIRLLFE